MARILDLSPEGYRRHRIHGEGRIWAETNCYVDVLVELIHALGFEPVAGLPFTFGIDFEGDQWTFFKYPPADLLSLYGFDLQELNPWNSLAAHVEEQVGRGRPVLVELDSFFLPDTAGTAYRKEHVKTTVAVNEISVAERCMGYFHGQGYYRVDGEDMAQLFQLDGTAHERILPPYVELVRLRPEARGLGAQEVTALSLGILRRNLALAPVRNPFMAFRARFEQDLGWLMGQPLDMFHRYSFATLRQYGACFELCSTYLEWLHAQGVDDALACAAPFAEISTAAKAYQFQLARAMARGRALDLGPVDEMGERWQQGMDAVRSRYG